MSDKDLQLLIQQLQTGSLEERIEAAKQLGDLQNPEVIRPLVYALAYQGPHYEFTEIRDAILKYGKATTPILIEATKSENSDIRAYAIEVLGNLRDESSFEYLLTILDSDTEGMIVGAVAAFGELAIEPLMQRVRNHPNPNVRQKAMTSITMISHPRVVEFAIEQAHDEFLRTFTIRAIGDAQIEEGLEERIQLMIHYLNDPNPSVRMYSAVALGQFKDEKVVDALIGHLNEPDKTVKYNIIQALGRIGNPKAVDALLHELSYVSIGILAAEALGEIGDKRAILHLSFLRSASLKIDAILEKLQPKQELPLKILKKDISFKNPTDEA